MSVSSNSLYNKLNGKAWTPEEDEILKQAVKSLNGQNWKAISELVPNRTFTQCSQRWRRIQPHKKRQAWTSNEDQLLINCVQKYGYNWALISNLLEGRTGKQVRERFLNHLNPELNKTKFNQNDDLKILQLFKQIGPKWKEISKNFKGRTENMIKNRFYSHIKKNLGENDLQYIDEIMENTKKKVKIEEKSHAIQEILTEKKENENNKLDFKKEEKNYNLIEKMSFLSKKKKLLEDLLLKIMTKLQICQFEKN